MRAAAAARSRARRGLRRRSLPSPHQPRPGPPPAHPRDRRQPGALCGRQVASAGRRGDPAHLPPGGRLPLRGEPSPRAVALAQRALDRASEGNGRDRGRSRGGDPPSSTRRQSLVEHMEAMGTSGFAASRVAALATRERKERATSPSFATRGSPAPPRWVSERSTKASSIPSRQSGRRPRSTSTTSPPTRPPSPRQLRPGRRRRQTRRHGRGGGNRRRRGDHSSVELTPVGDAATPGRPARFTTNSLLDLEREAIGIALDRGRRRPGRRRRGPGRGPRRCPDRALRRAACARGGGGAVARPDRLRDRGRRCRQDDRAPGPRRRPLALGHPRARRGPKRPRRRRAGARERHPGADPSLPAERCPALGRPAARLRADHRRGRRGQDPRARAGAAACRGGRGKGPPGRRPG